MATRVPSGLARIPLWKREIPKYPLYYKGDPQRREFLPLFWMKIIPPPEEKVPPNNVHFIVHPQMNKADIKQYLEKIYNVPVLSVRTELRQKDVTANLFTKGQITEARGKIWREEEKYAYVQLKKDKFEYPDFFSEGGRTEMMKNQIEMEAESEKGGKIVSKKTSAVGIPYWFTGYRNPSSKK